MSLLDLFFQIDKFELDGGALCGLERVGAVCEKERQDVLLNVVNNDLRGADFLDVNRFQTKQNQKTIWDWKHDVN